MFRHLNKLYFLTRCVLSPTKAWSFTQSGPRNIYLPLPGTPHHASGDQAAALRQLLALAGSHLHEA